MISSDKLRISDVEKSLQQIDKVIEPLTKELESLNSEELQLCFFLFIAGIRTYTILCMYH
jgi:hypothetical protein